MPTSKISDPWIDFRNNSGEFRAWLHVWGYTAQPAMCYPWAPLPWVSNEKPSGEFIRAMHGVGLLQRWPGDWKRWSPSSITSLWTENGNRDTPIYGALFNGAGDKPLLIYLRSVQKQCLSHADFMRKMNDRHVLFSKEKLNANLGFEKARAPFV